MRKYCKACGYQIEQNAEKCTNCSQSDFYIAQDTTQDDLEVQDGLMKKKYTVCTVCGSKSIGALEHCPVCGVPVGKSCRIIEDISVLNSISVNDYFTITSISANAEFLEAMIALKEKDIIEYELKMSQFRNQAQQIEQTKPKTKEKPITCPKCGSTSIISGTRGFTFTTGFFGSGNYRKVCENCGYKWKPGSLSESFDRAWFGNK